MRIWAAYGVGARLAGGCPPQSGGCHRLPPSAKTLPLSAKGLPLSAKTCHHLPRAATFWGGPSRSRGPLLSSVFNGCVGIVLRGLKLWHIDVAQRTELRSVASDLLLENEGQGHPRPVTVCHIEAEGRGTQSFAPVAGPSSSLIPSLALRAGVERLSGEYSAANKSPNRQRGNRETQTTPFAGRATRPTENEEHGLPGDGKTVAPWIHGRRPAPREGRAPLEWCTTCHDGAASAPQGHPIEAQGNALGCGASPRSGSPERAIAGLTCGPTLRRWDAPSGLGGLYLGRSPGRCPGLRWGAPLVLRKRRPCAVLWKPRPCGAQEEETCGRGCRRGRRPAPNGDAGHALWGACHTIGATRPADEFADSLAGASGWCSRSLIFVSGPVFRLLFPGHSTTLRC